MDPRFRFQQKDEINMLGFQAEEFYPRFHSVIRFLEDSFFIIENWGRTCRPERLPLCGLLLFLGDEFLGNSHWSEVPEDHHLKAGDAKEGPEGVELVDVNLEELREHYPEGVSEALNDPPNCFGTPAPHSRDEVPEDCSHDTHDNKSAE